MDSSYLKSTGGQEVNFEQLIDELREEYGPFPADAVCQAIRDGDMVSIMDGIRSLEDGMLLAPKSEAIQQARPDILKILLDHNAEIDEHMVALACERRDLDSIRLLLEYGWPVNQRLLFLASMLCFAVNDLDFLKWMINAGADVNALSTSGETALSIAIGRGSMDVVHFLLDRTDLTHGDLLHCAASRKNQNEGADLIDYLARKGHDVNAYRYSNPIAFRRRFFAEITPLYAACRENNVAVASALLKHGADPYRTMLTAGSPTARTPIDDALQGDNQELIDLFLHQDTSRL